MRPKPFLTVQSDVYSTRLRRNVSYSVALPLLPVNKLSNLSDVGNYINKQLKLLYTSNSYPTQVRQFSFNQCSVPNFIVQLSSAFHCVNHLL